MDVNGTRFHLVQALSDWEPWFSVQAQTTLGDIFENSEAFPDQTVEWNPREKNLRLAQQVIEFRSASDHPPTDLDNRRGAGRDRYGYWYWINEDRSGIVFLPPDAATPDAATPRVFWSSLSDDVCDPPPPDPGEFHTSEPAAPTPVTLRGLAVTRGHYLVVGVVGQGLLIFDLHRSAPPTLLTWVLPEGQSFSPWDLAATADGGVLVLDRENLRYWHLNQHFQLATPVDPDAEPPPETVFQPSDAPEDAPPRRVQQPVPYLGYELVGNDEDDAPTAPISIERGPNGTALILNAPDDAGSTVYEYENATLRTVYELDYSVPDEDTGTQEVPLHAHDFTYFACGVPEDDASGPFCMPLRVLEQATAGETVHLLFAARRDGNQVIAYRLEPETMDIDAQPDYLPLRRWQERAIVAAGEQVYYDFQNRWIPLGVFLDCEYAKVGVIQSPSDFERRYRTGEPQNSFTLVNGIPEQPFDSNIIGCEWHRLLLDAEIPPETAIAIHARASDDPEMLTAMPWVPQPKPYLRSGGAELPYYDPYAARRDDPGLGDRAGTWEILLQGVAGRYIQIQLTLTGNGRTTPEIQAVRLWYPRFSYQENYLPAIYGEDPVSASFTERLLANYEGLYTNLEDEIVQVFRLFDPRTVPPDALEWLASWLGVVLHPLWEEQRRRYFIRYAHKLYKMRGTVPGIIIALRIFLDDVEMLDASLFDPECVERSAIRVVEHYLTRDTAGTVFGDPDSDATGLSVAEAAHRFTVLLPHRDAQGEPLTSDTMAMVGRIIELEKPAHTWFELDEYYNMFRVGEARLGLDTQIGYSTHFEPLVLGDAILPGHYLGYPYPYNVEDRFVMERDQVHEDKTRPSANQNSGRSEV